MGRVGGGRGGREGREESVGGDRGEWEEKGGRERRLSPMQNERQLEE